MGPFIAWVDRCVHGIVTIIRQPVYRVLYCRKKGHLWGIMAHAEWVKSDCKFNWRCLWCGKRVEKLKADGKGIL